MPSSDSHRVRVAARCEEPRRTHGRTPAPPPLRERPVAARVSKRQPEAQEPSLKPETLTLTPPCLNPKEQGGGEEAHLDAGRLPPLTRLSTDGRRRAPQIQAATR
jgi:hypothetical protein